MTTLIYLLASDFKNNNYTSITDCILARACKRQIPGTDSVSVFSIYNKSNEVIAKVISGYRGTMYMEDLNKINENTAPNTLIRTLVVVKREDII